MHYALSNLFHKLHFSLNKLASNLARPNLELVSFSPFISLLFFFSFSSLVRSSRMLDKCLLKVKTVNMH